MRKAGQYTLQNQMMANPKISYPKWRDDLIFLLPCLFVALVVRSFFYGSITLADDVNYWMQIIATGLDNAWPPEKSHWHTRIGFVMPCVLLLKIFGLHVWAPYLFTLLGSLVEIALTFFIARQFTSDGAAKLAAWFAVFFPLNILYSGYLFTDIWSGLLGALSLWFWYRALQTDQARDYALTALFFGFAWLCRETVIMAAPIYLALWLQAGRWRRPKMLWTIPFGLSILFFEMTLYQATTHNWRYRFDSIFESKAQALEDVANDPGFLLTPLVQLITSHELGLFLVAGLAIAVIYYRRMPKALALWLIVGFIWFSWGTMTPEGWIPMQRDPRYLSVLTIPCLTILSIWIVGLSSRFWRWSFMAAFMVSGVLCAFLDVGRVKLSAHRRFIESEYNTRNAAAEPFVYFGIRAAQKFSVDAVKISCANDLGRAGTVKLIPHMPDARLAPSSEARYAIFSLQTQSQKWRTKIKGGWREVAQFSEENVLARERMIRLIDKIKGRSTMSSTAGLIVLENPAAHQAE